ncbi:UDP-N-acetylmuramoyl-L-alanyl-D-glutamate--2,6-diaminopimelate ligase [Phorcysia thermohydrogeniphila]|uniref:UDP-N-acetylmuramoyl-L-alanyl-D-glutamate--2,6-diaminopimelate ligase n=1 Tax=Phorcysia thermohydrogeniphila TaxID=936138 RepID=A0A4R1GGZ5_9BACT|nr:UDP-N-acetylmuramoyl-L-alanyl-D-glutamate--2,6-diaminopimelate ligase [Phorcysia thermohydrogeniphila]TCK06251.1 UDP-N-acetylmuramoylalanyl-D-glutamate--2,6-diaminopimelate ligase [Phorcysia thermohydrogeniphila]
MRLNCLLKSAGLPPLKKELEVTHVTDDSREVKPGSLFFALRGFKTDGNLFIPEAVKRGAVAVVTDSRDSLEKYKSLGVPLIFSQDLRRDLALIVSRFYGDPSSSIKVIGVTGTNGKTTTAYILYHLLNRLGKKTAIIGTVEYGLPGKTIPAERTTPSPTTFFRLLKEFKENGADFVVCEVSSHGLKLHRVTGTKFKGAVFTNLSPEHLDFHKNLWDYFLSKEKLFFMTRDVGVVNGDDKFGKLLLGLRGIFPCKLSSFGKKGEFRIERVENLEEGLLVILKLGRETYPIKTSLRGFFNAYNVAAAFSLLVELGFSPRELLGLFDGISVPGRMEEVVKNVFVDYAHTPDALEKVLRALRELKRGRLIVVFGCGGDRDREKRPLMGSIAEKLADFIILTNDNPRSEDPEQIVNEILSGIRERSKVEVIFDRRLAIERGLKLKKEEDILLIAGKGHETYQEVGSKKYLFDDREVVRELSRLIQ